MSPQQQQLIRGPFGGVVSDLPSTGMPPAAFDDVLNFFVRKGVAHTRPKLDPFASVDNTTFRNYGTFRDILGNYHTFGLVNYTTGQTPAYAYDGAVWIALGFPGLAAGQQGSILPFAVAYIQNQVYFANGGYPLWYLDGSASAKSANSPGTCRFLTVNVNHLIQAYTTEPAPQVSGSTIFPNRVRWSGANNPQSWDPGVDFTAGFNDLLDVPDEITGLVTIGRNTFIYRTNGLTVMFPTGLALQAFAFENFSVSPEGIGNQFPYSLSSYDNRAIAIALDDLYQFDGTGFTGIGGQNKKKIYQDLSAATGDVVWGKIIPGFPGLDFLSYWLTIPGPNVTWIYAFESGQWVRFTSSNGFLTALRTVATS